MTEAPRLCVHLASYSPGVTPFVLVETLDFYDGPAIASIRCTSCGSLALLRTMDFATAATRVFAMCGVSRAALERFAADALAEQGAQDFAEAVQMYEARFDRLFAVAGEPERLIACGSAWALDVIAMAPWPEGAGRIDGRWSEEFPDPDDDAWFARLGLDKWARDER